MSERVGRPKNRMIQLQPSMVLEAIFNLIGAIFLNEMDLLAVRGLSNLRRFIPICDDALSFARRRSLA
jgi:hypothetical protein